MVSEMAVLEAVHVSCICAQALSASTTVLTD